MKISAKERVLRGRGRAKWRLQDTSNKKGRVYISELVGPGGRVQGLLNSL